MTTITANEVITQNHVRYFVQPGGPGPGNPLYYSGQDNSYINISNVDNPVTGGISPINVQDPFNPGRYRRVGRSIDAADFPTMTVEFLQKRASLPRHLVSLKSCQHNFYQAVGDCRDLSAFETGWSAYIKVMSYGEVTSVSEGGSAWDSGEQIQDDLEFILAAVYNVGAISLGEKATTEIYSKAVDVVYGSRVSCGACGPNDDGTKLIYAVTDNTVASPGQAPSIVYSLDGGVTVTEAALTGSTSSDTPVAIGVMGQFLIVVVDDGGDGAYFHSEINAITGAPGAFTKVTTGLVGLGNNLTDLYVASAREAYISADGGYIYKIESVTQGVTVSDAGNATSSNLARIDGMNDVILAVGATGTVVYSLNKGRTWVAATSAGSDNLQALSVRNEYLWWVGDDAGNVYYTLNQGSTWVDYGWDSTAAAIDDIHFVTDEVGWISWHTSSPTGVVAATINGGRSWTTGVQRILNTPTYDIAYRIATPQVVNLDIAANNICLAGLAGNGSDGILIVGSAAVI